MYSYVNFLSYQIRFCSAQVHRNTGFGDDVFSDAEFDAQNVQVGFKSSTDILHIMPTILHTTYLYFHLCTLHLLCTAYWAVHPAY